MARKYTATYNEISTYVYEHYKYKVGGNCIAEAKEKVGLAPVPASNRRDPERRVTDCKPEILDAIFDAFRHFKMIE